MAVEVPKMNRFLQEEKMERKKESVLLSVEEERIGGAQTLRKESEEELFSEMLIPTYSEKRSSKDKKEVEGSEKNRPCLKNMMTPPLACGSLGERMPDR